MGHSPRVRPMIVGEPPPLVEAIRLVFPVRSSYPARSSSKRMIQFLWVNRSALNLYPQLPTASMNHIIDGIMRPRAFHMCGRKFIISNDRQAGLDRTQPLRNGPRNKRRYVEQKPQERRILADLLGSWVPHISQLRKLTPMLGYARACTYRAISKHALTAGELQALS